MGKRLSAQYLNSSLEAGRYYDDAGTGLHIYVRKSGSKSWSQKLRFRGRQIELGLGSYPAVTLAEARRKAAENKVLASEGINPKVPRQEVVTIPTFAEIADVVIRIKKAELSNEKHKAQWRSTLETYAFPTLGQLPVNEITIDDIQQVLEPIWKDKTETASRVRGRIQAVLDYAIVKKYRPAPNPAVWEGNLSVLLPSKPKSQQNHPALALEDAPRWWRELKRRDGAGAKALMLLTLTAARSGEIRGIRWDEITLFEKAISLEKRYVGIWTRPAPRMKAKVAHRVPITSAMLELLTQGNNQTGLIFASKSGKSLSDMTLSALMRRMHQADETGYVDKTSSRPAVPHGIRSTFRDWVAEGGHSREAAEFQLAHKFGSEVEHAYYRTDLIDARAELMNKWYAFLEGHP
ncbi:site-specific integrase [bacterium]|nr:site-specific integrase [bacterium]